MHNEDAMAVEKLSDGIRKFYADARKLEKFAQSMVAQKVGSSRLRRFSLAIFFLRRAGRPSTPCLYGASMRC